MGIQKKIDNKFFLFCHPIISHPMAGIDIGEEVRRDKLQTCHIKTRWDETMAVCDVCIQSSS